jgi:hypothetical protein
MVTVCSLVVAEPQSFTPVTVKVYVPGGATPESERAAVGKPPTNDPVTFTI